MGKIIDIVTNPAAELPGHLTVWQFYSLLGGVFLGGALANTGRVVLMKLVGERIVARLRTKLFDTFLRQEVAFFDRTRSGELISRLSVDTSVVGKTLSNNISDGLRSVAMSIGGLSMMAYVSGKLTLCMVFIVPPMAVAAVFYGRYVRSLSKQTQTALGEVTKVAEERLGNVRTVFAFARESDESKRYSARVNDVFALARKEAGLTGNLTVLAVLALGGSMVSQGQISVGELASFLMYTAYVGTSTMGVTSFYSELMKGLGAGSRLFELLDREPAIPKTGGARLPVVRGEIRFDHVDFTYPTRPGSQVLDDLSFTVKPGTSLAVAGTSGGGKSTIGSLILRFYDVTRGQVLIDGTDVRELDVQWWRSNVGVVSQEPVLFAGTLADNIRYAHPEATMDQVEAAARMANCDFIQRLPDRFDTWVGERGVSLSGGQKQRVAIARALLKNPRVLILDEATSALDAESEQQVQDALDRLARNRTVITIAHRASTLQRSDVILCLDGGRAVELGSYARLMEARGVFWRIMERQRAAAIEAQKAQRQPSPLPKENEEALDSVLDVHATR
ncbi:P-loop containing nucleoside triphosphate hydrolase protein [Syncephalis pseudoplumigaleata]|uniref:P-loop containing nucleoside triphosphate hydrolase protein n=1 Tax=Syncephalis pseudoplumigaleata TaxID=1712513 RepID=A0A4P9Z1C7_9FUNG|nr:P-loop containing nucleoside triphosphate hydrolase protein [Syncephalis pseudoplumigaleata]|eukprot:RKP26234.1 P-loop containing nucleoside triphosphate hydrolase protein [Syncephalis pseudoplumigaleata]